jgi:hypothetical protein
VQAVLIQSKLPKESDDVLLARCVRQAPQLDDRELPVPVVNRALCNSGPAPGGGRGPVPLWIIPPDVPVAAAVPASQIAVPEPVISDRASMRGGSPWTRDESSAGGAQVLDWRGVDGAAVLDLFCDGLVVIGLLGGEHLDVAAAHVLPILLECKVDLRSELECENNGWTHCQCMHSGC